MSIDFEWDPADAEKNRRKHGLSFEIAARVFADPFALSWLERIDNGEQRWQTLGGGGRPCVGSGRAHGPWDGLG